MLLKKRILKIKTKKKSSKQTKKQQKRNNKKETTKKKQQKRNNKKETTKKKQQKKNNIKNTNTTVNQTIVGGKTDDVIELVLGTNIRITKEFPPVIFCEIIIDTKKDYCCFEKDVDYVYFHDELNGKKYVFFNKLKLEDTQKQIFKDEINAIDGDDVRDKIKKFNRKYNYKYAFINLLYFREDLTEAKKEIEFLNGLLLDKGLKLELDYFYELVKKNERFALFKFDNFV